MIAWPYHTTLWPSHDRGELPLVALSAQKHPVLDGRLAALGKRHVVVRVPRVIDRESLPVSPLRLLALASPVGALPYLAPLPRIARELGIDPKKARARLRKAHGAAWKEMSEKELRDELV